jgi:glucose 1-dehydrogenase
MKSLINHTVIISGALGDIGRDTVLECARQGADIAAGDILKHEAAREIKREVEKLGRQFHYQQCDVSSAKEVSDWLCQVTEELSLPDIVVSNAAVVKEKNLREIDSAEWQRQISINLTGSFNLTSSCANRLAKANVPGRIVFVGSWAASNVHSNIPAYCVSKAGLRMLMKCMAAEFAQNQILVNEIAPGIVDAGVSARIFNEDQLLKEKLISQIPVGQLITSVEIAKQIVHLCSFDNQHMTGTTLLIDGGLSLSQHSNHNKKTKETL